MNLTDCNPVLIAGVFTLAGAVVGALSTYCLARRLADRQYRQLREISKLDAWHAAAREFIAAFAGDLAVLESRSDPTEDVRDRLLSSYPRQSQAVATFEHFVPGARRAAFRRAWRLHCYGADSAGAPLSPEDEELAMDHETLLFLDYSRESHLKNPERPRLLAIRAIRGLISYALEEPALPVGRTWISRLGSLVRRG